MKIDPKNVTNFERTDEELQNFWLFCTFVAGKNADIAADKLSKFLSRKPENETPFEYLRYNTMNLHNMLVAHRVGQYTRLEKAISDSLSLNLRTCTVADLESVHGVGPKTARMFMLHTRPNSHCAVLDVHILRWLDEHMSFKSMGLPQYKATPQNAKHYATLENLFINLAGVYYRGIPLADVDLLIWSQMSGRLDNDNYEPTLPGQQHLKHTMHQQPLVVISGRVRPHYKNGEHEGYEVIYDTNRGQRISWCSFFTADQAQKHMTDVLNGNKPETKL